MAKEYPLVSVVVPVYNVERYVEQCVESLVAQDYPNLEILLIDDGATDSSGDVCDRLAAAHDCVQCFHKENGGLSDARNFGLAHAHGDWVSFVDSDDFVSPIFVSTLFSAALDCGCPVAALPGGKDFRDGELCELLDKICPVTPEAPRGDRRGDATPGGLTYGGGSPRPVAAAPLGARDVLRQMLYQRISTGAQWRLYRKDILGEDPFPKGLYYEDLASTYKFVHRAGRVALLDCRDLYAYRLRSTSIIRQSYSHIKGYSALVVAEQLERDIRDWYPELATAVASRCFSVCRMVYGQVPTGKRASEEDIHDSQALWQVIEAHRDLVAADPDARRRERLAARIAQLGEGPFAAFCRLARGLGKMQ